LNCDRLSGPGTAGPDLAGPVPIDWKATPRSDERRLRAGLSENPQA
jgi:hypothetical protein